MQVEVWVFGEYLFGSVWCVLEFLFDLCVSWLLGCDVFEYVIYEWQEVVCDLIFQVVVIDENGMLVYFSIGFMIECVDLSQCEYFCVYKEFGGCDVLFISDLVQGKVLKKWLIQFICLIFRVGQFVGVVVVLVSLEQFVSFVNMFVIGKDGVVMIICELGQVLVCVFNLIVGIEKLLCVWQFNKLGVLGIGNYCVVLGIDGVECIIGYYYVLEIGLYFLVGELVVLVFVFYDGYWCILLVEVVGFILLFVLLYFMLCY